MFYPFVHKRQSYAYEQEVRAIVAKWPDDLEFKDTIANGLSIDVDVKKLIETVYLAPSSAPWFEDLVRAVSKRYGYQFHVIKSPLFETPFY